MQERNPRYPSRGLVWIQSLMGLFAHLFMAVPYLRRVHGTERLRDDQRYLFACNHVSLLDTILLGALCWRSGCYPILVLGDKSVWRASFIRRALSGPIGFLLDRGRLNPNRLRELQAFGRAGEGYHLVVFPEGTRGDGVNVLPCQAGIYFVAQEARIPIVPVLFENMQLVSTKKGRFHPIGGLSKVEVYFGEAILPEDYLAMEREEFLEFLRESIAGARPRPVATAETKR
jgi:1-acyl-sn-glycerol-3-phosphate acyltransferase